AADTLREVGQIVWREPGLPGFGGLSGLIVSPDGGSLTAVTDRGQMLEARIERSAQGTLASVAVTRFEDLTDPTGAPLARFATDAEGLAQAADGGLFVSFEGRHRIARLPRPFARPRPIPASPAFVAFSSNSGLEALAVDAVGDVYALAEQSADRIPVFRWDGTDWDQPFDIPGDPFFRPTGADFGPRGRLYLLERGFNLLAGFRIRVRRFERVTGGWSDGEIVFLGAPNAYDNAEGISLWTTAAGEQRLVIVSDNNFQALQRTLLTEFRLQESPAPR
ncbi:MAG: esterase-like activity of phytase family protein, partial [Pseudomonadota bacterium]